MPRRPFAQLRILRTLTPAARLRFELPAWTFRTTRLAAKRSA